MELEQDLKKATQLTKLKLTELSLVDKGANPGAVVTIFKCDDNLFFDGLVDQIAKRDECSRAEAMTTARIERPGAYEKYQGEIVIEKSHAISTMTISTQSICAHRDSRADRLLANKRFVASAPRAPATAALTNFPGAFLASRPGTVQPRRDGNNGGRRA